MKKTNILMALVATASTTFLMAPKAHAMAPMIYGGTTMNCFMTAMAMPIPVCAGVTGAQAVMAAAMTTGPLAFLDGEAELKPISIQADLQELVDLEALTTEQAQVVYREISAKIAAANGNMAFNLSALVMKANGNAKVLKLMKDNQISKVTAIYLARLAGQNLKF